MIKLIKFIIVTTLLLAITAQAYHNFIPHWLKDHDALIIERDSLPEIDTPFPAFSFYFMTETPFIASSSYIAYRDIVVSGIKYRVYMQYSSIFENFLQLMAITYGSHTYVIKTCDPNFVSPSGVRFGDAVSEIKRTSTEPTTFSGTPIGDGWKIPYTGKTVKCFIKM